MPTRIVQDNGQTAVIEYPDGTVAELPWPDAADEVQRSYGGTPGEGPVPGVAYNNLQQPVQVVLPSPEQITYEEGPPADMEFAPDVTPYAERRLAALQAGGGGYGAPVANPQITPHGAFGAPRSEGRTHQGTDFVAPQGEPILAVGDGVVEAAGPSEGDGGRGGLRVRVRHPDGSTSSSMHLSETLVQPGQEVTQGQPLGLAGNTGTSSGAHLHQKFMDPTGRPVDAPTFYGGAQVGSPGGGLAPGIKSVSVSGPVTVPVPPAPTPPDPAEYIEGANRAALLGAQAAELDYQTATGMAEVQAQQARDQADMELDARVRHHAAWKATVEDHQRYEAGIQDALNRIPSVDPGRVWKNAGAFGSAIGMLSAGIGGWMQVMKGGGPNYALENIQKVIDQDIRAQETDIQTAREGVFRAERAADRGRQFSQDRMQFLEEQRAFRYRSLAAAAQAEMAQFQSPIAQANYLRTIQGLDEAANTAAYNASNLNWNQKQKNWADYIEASQGQARIGLTAAQMDAQARRDALEKQGTPLLLGNPLRNDSTYWQVDPAIAASMGKEEIAKLRDFEKGFPLKADVVKKSRDYVSALSDLGRTYAGKGNLSRFSPTAKERAHLNQLYEAFASAHRRALAGAALTEYEGENFKKIAPPPPGYLSYDFLNEAANYSGLAADSAQSIVNTYKFREVDPTTGQSKPVDLTSEWGDIKALKIEPPDGTELRERMNQSAAAIELGTEKKAAGSFTPKEPKQGEPSNTFTGETKKPRGPINQETATALVKDAQTFLNYARKAPEEGGVSFDLAQNVMRDLAKNAATLDRHGFEAEAGSLLEIASDIKETLTKAAARKREDERERESIQEGHLPGMPGGL